MIGQSTIAERRPFALLFVVLMAVAAGNTALQSVLPAIGREIGIPDLLIALVFSFSALLWTISAPFWAHKSDSHGRKALVRLGLAGFIISMALSALVILAGLHKLIAPLSVFIAFVLTRSLFGLFGSASNPAAQAYVAARTSLEERTPALATLSSAFGLGTIIGPAIAPFFVLPIVGLSGPMFFFAGIAAIILWAVTRWLPSGNAQPGEDDAADVKERSKLKWTDPRIAPFLLYGFVVGSTQAATGQTLGFLIIDLLKMQPEKAQPFIGVAMMAGAGTTLLAQWGLIRMLRLSPQQLMVWGAGLALAGNIVTAFAPTYGTVVSAFALMSLGFGFARPGFTSGSSLAVGLKDQGAIAGAVTAVNGACFILAPALGIALYHMARPAPFLISACMLGVAMVYSWRSKAICAIGHTAATEANTFPE